MSRNASISRKTNETTIELQLELDGAGNASIDTGVGFLDHMLELLTKHGLIDLTVKAQGDLHVDQHHTVEDVGICLGLALKEALGDKAGIRRYGSIILPMEDALVICAIDLSGRFYLELDTSIPSQKIGEFDTELIAEFWQAFATNTGCNLHVRQLAGKNSHHISEAIFKGVARSLRQAIEIDPRQQGVPSSKGVL